MLRLAIAAPFCLAIVSLTCSSLSAQMREDQTVRDSIAVLNEIMSTPTTSIPRRMLVDAHAVAIIPKVIKGSFVVGARHGNGVLLVRDPHGGWHAPVFISLTGGNIGWQVGVQSTDVVLVFRTQRSVSGLLSGKFTLGADAAVAAGPVGGQASAATDAQLGAEIFSWSRSRGLFLGVSFDGSVIDMDQMANATYYRPTTVGGPVVVPPAAQQLASQLLQQTGVQQAATSATPAVNASAVQNRTILAQQHSTAEVDHVRDQLAMFARELYKILDPAWQNFLGLPVEVFQANGHPSVESLQESFARFESVRTNTNFAQLANHPQFQSTYGLLAHYIQELSANQATLNLPPPPVNR
ncbi:MAG: lipid-binding SYLF domain-containing protein [Pirellulaceae bacterium]